MLTYGDGVADVDIKRLVEFHRSHGKLATVTTVRPQARFGSLRFDGDRITSFVEKPQTGEGWINGGFFVLEPYNKRFKQEQILVLFTEDLRKDPVGVLGPCFKFLEVDNTVNNIDLTPQNISFDKQYDRSYTKLFRQRKSIVRIAQGLPKPMKHILKHLFTQKKKQRPQWDSETLRHVIDTIWDDNMDFLAKHNKSDTFWTPDEYC
jgi:hypothetical protein